MPRSILIGSNRYRCIRQQNHISLVGHRGRRRFGELGWCGLDQFSKPYAHGVLQVGKIENLRNLGNLRQKPQYLRRFRLASSENIDVFAKMSKMPESSVFMTLHRRSPEDSRRYPIRDTVKTTSSRR